LPSAIPINEIKNLAPEQNIEQGLEPEQNIEQRLEPEPNLNRENILGGKKRHQKTKKTRRRL
jgi:hypothetical protein